jgi:hypothetical protein
MKKYIIILSNLKNSRTDNSYKNLVDRIQSHQSRKVYHALPPHVLIFDFDGSNVEAYNDLKGCIDETDQSLFLPIDSSFLEKGSNAVRVKLLKDFFRNDSSETPIKATTKEEVEEIHEQSKAAGPLTANVLRAGQESNCRRENVTTGC